MRTQLGTRDERHCVVAWRRAQLLANGFPLPLATAVAHDSRYDLHALIELAENGCPPALAVRILAPHDAEATA